MKNKVKTILLIALVFLLSFGLYCLFSEYDNMIKASLKIHKGEFVTANGYDLGEGMRNLLKDSIYMLIVISFFVVYIICWALKTIIHNVFPNFKKGNNTNY